MTGRTQHIRIHSQHLGFPIVNDPLYDPVAIESRRPSAEAAVAMEVSGTVDERSYTGTMKSFEYTLQDKRWMYRA